MTYTGEIKDGIIVLKDAPQLEEGSVVRVEVDPPNKFRRGSAEAILRHAGIWADCAEEVDRMLEELHQSKWEEVRRQQLEPEDTL